MANKTHFLVIGATGPSGIAFCETALASGHQLTILARNPSKLPSAIQQDDNNVTIIQGEFTDNEKVNQAIHTGASILVSFAGPAIPAKGTAITHFYETLFPLIRTSPTTKISRLLILSTASFSVPDDTFSLKWWLAVLAVRLLFGDAYAEVRGIGRVTTAQPLGELEWTVFRVPGLTNGVAKPVKATFVGRAGDGLVLSRRSAAVWVLQEVEARRWVGRCPVISHGGWI